MNGRRDVRNSGRNRHRKIIDRQDSSGFDDPESVGFENIIYPPPRNSKWTTTDDDDNVLASQRRKPLEADEFNQLLDSDGRLVNEHELRRQVFLGGVDAGIRQDVWQFLFELYPATSTERERRVLRMDNHAKYHALKRRWSAWLVLSSNTGDGEEQGVTADYLNVSKAQGSSTQDTEPIPQLTDEETQQMRFIEIQAEVHAARKEITEIELLRDYIRIIDKDVPRTDRDIEFYKGQGNPQLNLLRNILVTYASYHPEVGYTQGMNDILSRILYVFKDEVDSYWCFTNYMAEIFTDFLEKGMIKKLELLQQLFQELDSDLYNYLVQNGVGDMMFCHRWLLLGFKREFQFEDSLRCFEILTCQYLELSSMEAQKAMDKERQRDFQDNDGNVVMVPSEYNQDFTFELFVCVAILLENREELFKATDCADFFQLINGLSCQLNLDTILTKAELLFYKYCQRSVADCFQVIDTPSPSVTYTKKTFL